MFIDLSNQLITANGEMYSTCLAFEDLFSGDDPDSPQLSRKRFNELIDIYESANRLLYEQLSELKSYRTAHSFQALAAKRIALVRGIGSRDNLNPVKED